VLLSLGTGIRRGSALALEWSHVSADNKSIDVPGEVTKNGEPLIVHVHSKLQDVLKQWRKQSGGKGRVFEVGDPKKAWHAVLGVAQIKNFRCHDLRHSFASKLLRLGVPRSTISGLLGHKSIETTSRHYAHLASEGMISAVERLAG
jgi:integrase